MMRKTETAWISASLVLAIAGCSDKSTSLGSVYVKQGLISSSKGGSLAVTQADCDRDAAFCRYVGTSIVIPRGALPADETIVIRVGDESKDRDGKPNGPALDFGPDGTTFSSPVEITLPVAREIDEDRLRVYVTQADGTKSVLMPNQLAYDRIAKQVRFLTDHFTTFQCGEANDDCSDVASCPGGSCQNGQCIAPCDPAVDCGPQPGAPSWPCEDGTVGGSQCVRLADGSCGWEIIDCPSACAGVSCPPGSTCDPTTGNCVSQCVCPDGQLCELGPNGTVWCPGCDPNSCPPGSTCDPASGHCVNDCVCPNGQTCTINPDGTTSCNGGGCGNGIACPPGSTCDPATGTCVNDCVCPDGQPCMTGPNGSVVCAPACDANSCPPGSSCDPATGNCVSSCVCPDGQPCAPDPNGTVSCGSGECDPSQCGPQPGVPSWTCEDGTAGGSTGRCLLNPDGSCGWEIIWCPMPCGPNDCSTQPPPPDPNEACADGSIAPYVCRHDANGACSWEQSCEP